MKQPKESIAQRYIVSSIITIIAITVMTIASEFSEKFKDLLKHYMYHHWVGKGIIALVVFALFAFVFPISVKNNVRSLVNQLVAATIICGLVIFLFFLWIFFA